MNAEQDLWINEIMMVNFKIGDKCDVKDEINDMTRAWGKEKNLSSRA